MHPLLLAKVRVWASASGGCFPTSGLSYGEEQIQPNLVAKYNRFGLFKWAKVISKRCYAAYESNTSLKKNTLDQVPASACVASEWDSRRAAHT
jgi:hypothetical protein